VTAICVPGINWAVRREAEAEGIDQISADAGFEWAKRVAAFVFYAGGPPSRPARA